MKVIKKIALYLAVLFTIQTMPANVFAVSLTDYLSEESRGISILAHYIKEDVGRAGVLYVNEYNQETIIKRLDASILSDDTQLELIYYYSSYENGFSSQSPYGNHWKTNYDIKLQYDAEKDQFVYLHNDGATVVFEKTDEMQGEDTCWTEKLTMLCRLDKLYVKGNSTNPADARIETQKGETLTFDAKGHLIRIKTQQSDIQITYHLNQISEISDSNGNRLKFNYRDDNMVDRITAYQGKTPILIERNGQNVPYQIQYQYDIRGRLVSVTYPDGESISYEYLFPDKLSAIQNIDEKRLEISYAQKRAETVQQISSKNPALSRSIVSLKHNSSNRIVKSELFGETTYQYNEYGLLVYDDKEMEKIDVEAKEEEIASEKATAERVKPCPCEDCYLVACECECDREENCNCFSCNISSSLTIDQKVLPSESAITNMSQSDIKQYPSGYVVEETDSLGTKTIYQYDMNQNLTREALQLSNITDNIIENKYQYVDDKLVSIENNNTKYDLLYDEWGHLCGADIGGKPHVRYHYVDGNINFLQTQSYANGQCISYTYDNTGRISSISMDGKTAIFEFKYLSNDDVKITNYSNNTIMLLKENSYQILDLDENEVLFSVIVYPGRQYTLKIGNQSFDVQWQYVYDAEDGKHSLQYKTQGNNTEATVDVIRNYDNDDVATVITTSCGDKLGNTFSRTFNENGQYEEEFLTSIYQNQDTSTSKQWKNQFDEQNRLVAVTLNEEPYAKYTYDSAGQLIKMDDFISGQTIQYTYDCAGNLLDKNISLNSKQPQNTSYVYDDWERKDQLTKFNGRQIVYDSIGNPITYNNTSFTWTLGRQLKSITTEQQCIEYTYGDDGLRQSKTVYRENNPIYQYRYLWSGEHLLGFDYYDYLTEALHTIVFILDDEGTPYGFIVDDKNIYLYEKNILGDIVGIYQNGIQVASYHYGAYGEILSCYENNEIQKYNILTYRGYCYDRETEMYYLQSRYYVPEWGRFLNADQYIDTGTGALGTNIYTYCGNDPVNYIDPNGFWKIRKDDNSHDKLTRLVFEGEGYTHLESMIDGNVWIDEEYSALIITNNNQKYHFDRHRQMSEYSDDTRSEMAAYWIQQAISYPENSINEAIYIGRAMHSMQDYSSHGNIGINHSWAAHGINGDNREYIWKDDTLRGSDEARFFSGVKKTSGTQFRWEEAKENTAGTILLYALAKMMQSI